MYYSCMLGNVIEDTYDTFTEGRLPEYYEKTSVEQFILSKNYVNDRLLDHPIIQKHKNIKLHKSKGLPGGAAGLAIKAAYGIDRRIFLDVPTLESASSFWADLVLVHEICHLDEHNNNIFTQLKNGLTGQIPYYREGYAEQCAANILEDLFGEDKVDINQALLDHALMGWAYPEDSHASAVVQYMIFDYRGGGAIVTPSNNEILEINRKFKKTLEDVGAKMGMSVPQIKAMAQKALDANPNLQKSDPHVYKLLELMAEMKQYNFSNYYEKNMPVIVEEKVVTEQPEAQAASESLVPLSDRLKDMFNKIDKNFLLGGAGILASVLLLKVMFGSSRSPNRRRRYRSPRLACD